MPLPIISNPNEQPCGGYLRDGSICLSDRCTRPHIPIDRLTPESQKEWFAHVRKHRELSFNTERVKGIKRFLAYSKAGDEEAKEAKKAKTSAGEGTEEK